MKGIHSYIIHVFNFCKEKRHPKGGVSQWFKKFQKKGSISITYRRNGGLTKTTALLDLAFCGLINSQLNIIVIFNVRQFIL